MKTGEVAKLLGVSDNTIRNYIKEFDEFLDPQRTRHRTYTEKDLRVLATIAKFSHAGFNMNAIRDKLKDGELVDSPSETNYGVDTRMVPAAAMEQMIDASEIRMELERVNAERNKLTELLDTAQQTIEKKDEEINTLKDELRQMERQLGKLEGRLEEIEKHRDS